LEEAAEGEPQRLEGKEEELMAQIEQAATMVVYLIDERRMALLRVRGHECCDVCGSPFQEGGAYAARPRAGSRHYCLLDAVKQGFDLINADGRR
ncbi:MAG: hypothetical protein JRN45_11360, partial [Nitrososphaerota archaeon]|nr:hypothetical protein [Nitrososphaerota archaeon]